MGKPTILNEPIMPWVEAFCSCAIEGNTLGIYMCELWNTNRDQFITELKDYLEGRVTWDGEKWQ